MNHLFTHARSHWVGYSEYTYRTGSDGILYLTPAKSAVPNLFDPLLQAENLVVDALNIGMLCLNSVEQDTIQASILEYATKYGLLGLMTALPTTSNFMDYDTVYLPKNHFIREESMDALEFVSLFFPFDTLDLFKKKERIEWNIAGDTASMALALTMSDRPMAVNMAFQREYAERYDWLVTQFKDLAFTFMTSFLYYDEQDQIDEVTQDLYRKGIAAFGGIAPTYHIALLEKPTIVWDFHSLLLMVQMMFSFLVTDDKAPLRACKHCQKAFIAKQSNSLFCSSRCKNQYNVYKSRNKAKE